MNVPRTCVYLVVWPCRLMAVVVVEDIVWFLVDDMDDLNVGNTNNKSIPVGVNTNSDISTL